MLAISNKKIECIEMHTQAGASAVISLHGGQLLSWKPLPCVEEQLYLSELAVMDGSSAIRGGVPVLFPHFGAQSNSPNHGFARLLKWRRVSEVMTEDSSVLILELTANKETKSFWPCQFRLRLTITLLDKSILLEYEVVNTGEDAFDFSGGLHTYLSTKDILEARLTGLNNCGYVENGERYEELSQSLKITSEVDRAYFTGEQKVQLLLSSPERRVLIESACFNETVIWNPWINGAQKLSDMPDEDYLKMLCVESVLATEKNSLQPGQSWKGSQCLKYEKINFICDEIS
jgi:glucose-6-phosphate 1-epimerase